MTKPRHRVEEFMSTAVVSVRQGDSLARAAQEMALAAVRHLPVVDERRHVVGMLTSHDVVASLQQGGDPEVVAAMRRDVHHVHPETAAHVAVATMIDQKLDALAVIDPKGELCGILTATDFLVIAYQALTDTPLGRTPSEL
jgi:CBS domain-containing protein